MNLPNFKPSSTCPSPRPLIRNCNRLARRLRLSESAARRKSFNRVTLGSCDLPILLDDRAHTRSITNITAAACNTTGAIMGFVVSAKLPSAQTLEMCLENAVLPKKHGSGIGITKHRYEMHGMPEAVIVDCDSAGRSFVEQNEALGCFNIEIKHPARSAALSGLERFFHRLARDLPNYLKVTGWYPVMDGRYHRFHKGRPFTLNDLNTAVLQYVVDYYHQVPRRDGKTIAQAWKEGTEAQGHPLQCPKVA